MFSTPAFADTTANTISTSSHNMIQLLIFVGFGLAFYLLILRPQMQRAKEHQILLNALSMGDIVQTTGGIIGRINQIKANHIRLEVTKGVSIYIQKEAILNVLPKGSFHFDS